MGFERFEDVNHVANQFLALFIVIYNSYNYFIYMLIILY